jgi:DNA-binding NtrC family response regulator
VIAATHRDLERMVREGTFREDLLFRLNVVRLNLPPLRERRDDIRLLLDHFLKTFTTKFKKQIRGFTSQVLELLLNYPFPGNVRELRNIVEYASNLCQEHQVQLEHLPAYLLQPTPAAQPHHPSIHASAAASSEPGPGDTSGQSDPAARERKMILEELLKRRDDRERMLEWPEIERKMIVEAIVKAQGRRNHAAALLGWSRSRFYRKMKRHGIQA